MLIFFFSLAIWVIIMIAASQTTGFPSARVQFYMGVILLESLDLYKSYKVKDQISYFPRYILTW